MTVRRLTNNVTLTYKQNAGFKLCMSVLPCNIRHKYSILRSLVMNDLDNSVVYLISYARLYAAYLQGLVLPPEVFAPRWGTDHFLGWKGNGWILFNHVSTTFCCAYMPFFQCLLGPEVSILKNICTFMHTHASTWSPINLFLRSSPRRSNIQTEQCVSNSVDSTLLRQNNSGCCGTMFRTLVLTLTHALQTLAHNIVTAV